MAAEESVVVFSGAGYAREEDCVGCASRDELSSSRLSAIVRKMKVNDLEVQAIEVSINRRWKGKRLSHLIRRQCHALSQQKRNSRERHWQTNSKLKMTVVMKMLVAR